MPGNNTANQGYVDARDHQSLIRAQEVVNLRVVEGISSWREIGERVGISHTAARNLYLKHMDQLKAHTEEEFRVAQTIELMRLDGLWKLNFERATDGDGDDGDLQQRASITCLRISESRRKLLGLDAAERMELTGAGGSPLFDFSGLTGDALDRELQGYFDQGYMEGAADGYKAADKPKAKAKRAKAKPKAEKGQAAPPEPEPEERTSTTVVALPPGSQGQARV